MEEKFLKIVEEFRKETEKECYKISFVEGTATILDDKIGGMPYLPVGEEYPTDKDGNPLALLLQINLKNIDLEGYPKKGILEIFTDSETGYPCQYAVRYFEEGLEYQEDLPLVDTSMYIIEEPIKIEVTKDICHMTINDYRFMDIVCKIISDIFSVNVTNYRELESFFGDFPWYERFASDTINHYATIGGYADFTQEDPRSWNVKDKDECLFKLDSCANNKLNIGDAGILFTLISKSDIENCNFQNAFVDWDCC